MLMVLAFMVAAPSSATVDVGRVMSVSEVLRRHDELDRRTIRISGVVRRCTRISCALSDPNEPSAFLGIAPSRSFDRQIKRWIGRPVTVEARLDADCLHYLLDKPEDRTDDVLLCGDRAGDLDDPRIVLPR